MLRHFKERRLSAGVIRMDKKLGLSSKSSFQWDDSVFLQVPCKVENEEGHERYN